MNADQGEHIFGIDLGGSSVKGVVMTPAGERRAEENIDYDPGTHLQWSEKIQLLYDRWRARFGSPVGVGLSAPGLARKDGSAIAFMPGRLKGLEGFDFTSFLKTSRPTPVCNDAHAALLGESWAGAARGYDNVMMLTLGTGVGGAAMVNGRMLFGSTGRAGHFGHTTVDPWGAPDICNCPGSLERAIGNCTIVERSSGRFLTTHDLVKAHVAGDKFASEVWLRSIRALAAAIASFINIVDCEAVIVGGGVARSGEHLFNPLQEFVDQFEWRPGGKPARILAAQLGEYAGAIGAAYNGLDRKI